MWFNDANVYCEYDTEHQRSNWTLLGTPDTSYGGDEIESVWVEILGSYLYTYVNQFELALKLMEIGGIPLIIKGAPKVHITVRIIMSSSLRHMTMMAITRVRGWSGKMKVNELKEGMLLRFKEPRVYKYLRDSGDDFLA